MDVDQEKGKEKAGEEEKKEINFEQLRKNLPVTRNRTFFDMVDGKKTDHVPVWLMRQAGLYLPEYKAVRKNNDFFTICRSPELACEVTLQPIDRFPGLDASIIFSDILVVPQALGMECVFISGKGPTFPDSIKREDDLEDLLEGVRKRRRDGLKAVDVKEKLGYVLDAITLTRTRLDGRVPLLGFVGSPWTLMAYMMEGHGSQTFPVPKSFLYSFPSKSKELLQILTDVLVDFLILQWESGAEGLMVFDSHGGMLSPTYHSTFSLPYLLQIVKRVKEGIKERWAEKGEEGECPKVPMGVFSKGAHYAIEKLADSGYDIVGLDWTIDPAKAVARTGGKVCLQGNLDPCALYGPREVIRAETKTMLEGFKGARLIANLGHGVHHEHRPSAVNDMVEAVHDYSYVFWGDPEPEKKEEEKKE